MLDAGSLVSGLQCLQLPEQSADDYAYGQEQPLASDRFKIVIGLPDESWEISESTFRR